MKRYRLSVGPGYEFRDEEHSEGEWVRFEDVQNFIVIQVSLLRAKLDEADTAELRAETERLRAERARLLDDYFGGRTYDYEASERHLAFANVLLDKAERALTSPCDRLRADIRAHLAAQPAITVECGCLLGLTPEGRCNNGERCPLATPAIGDRCPRCDQRLDASDERDAYHSELLEQAMAVPTAPSEECPSCNRELLAPARTEADAATLLTMAREAWSRTEAEQAVLDAMALVKVVQSSEGPACILSPEDHDRLGSAELARRGRNP